MRRSGHGEDAYPTSGPSAEGARKVCGTRGRGECPREGEASAGARGLRTTGRRSEDTGDWAEGRQSVPGPAEGSRQRLKVDVG